MGLTPGNVLTPLGGLMACMLGRRFLSARPAELPASVLGPEAALGQGVPIKEGPTAQPLVSKAETASEEEDLPFVSIEAGKRRKRRSKSRRTKKAQRSPDSRLRKRVQGPAAGAIWASPYVWFVVLCWTVAAPALFARTFSLQHKLALEVVLGPMPLTGSLTESAALALLTVPGLLAASFWSSSLHRVQGSETSQEGKNGVDSLLRWGETALAASIVAAPLWGPSLGALVLAPIDGQTGRRVAVSFGITCVAVAISSFLRRYASQPARGVLLVCAGLSLCVIALAPVLR